MTRHRPILLIIVIAQFCCTSLWFASNAVMEGLLADFGLELTALGHLTSAVQLGFIVGTLIFALLSVADRYAPSTVFFICALAGSIFNLGVLWNGNTLATLIAFRSLTGFCLAGIYPVGMKIAADHFEKGLGKSLGYLVGALVLGTAFPHFLKAFTGALPWKMIIIFTSILATLGGFALFLLVPNGPYRKAAAKLDLSASLHIFRKTGFRAAAYGYFGHMWELYTFWAFVPAMLSAYSTLHGLPSFDVALWAFLIIGVGGIGCVFSGLLSVSWGSKRIASMALTASGCCCLISPLMFMLDIPALFLSFLLFWGVAVIADSPLFSTLIAQHAPAHIKGTALTLVNCIGYAITIFSIQLINVLMIDLDIQYVFIFLAIGPVLGLIGLSRNQYRSVKK
ncbi:MFS transporter [Echinicola strongylocentroti]|uniref:MFS transporter n=1 Tax=Echinicola strongylocentroti TaxID=1795355 RepID=A0A2Z4IIF5_9BACT|nr:MFS transporter [Echinicola strongylocentroti]AWW30911.1 MFS transporter [Echinicola strongylocentroti]